MKKYVLILLCFSLYFNGFCQFALNGTVKTESEAPIEGVLMNENPVEVTDVFGNYAIDNLAAGNYEITATHDSEFLNGVTVCDIVAMQRHLLQIELLDSPFKIIAGDVNASNSITAFDMVVLSKKILRVDTGPAPFRNWVFVKPDIEFSNPMNPFESLDYDHSVDVLEDTSQDLIGIKGGDVNNSALGSYPSTELPETDILFFEPDGGVIAQQDNYVVNFRAQDYTDVYGYQFTLSYDETKMEFVSMNSDFLNSIQSYTHLVELGAVTMIWFDYLPATFDDSTNVFSATFNILEDTDLSESLELNSDFTTIASMDLNGCYGEVENVIPVLSSENHFLKTFRAYPNPTSDMIAVELEMDEVSVGSMELYNAIGQTVFKKNFSDKSVFEQIKIERHPSGIYLLSIEVNNEISSQRIIKL